MAEPDRISQTLASLAEGNVLERIWRRDPTVWSREAGEIPDRLGWLDDDSITASELTEMKSFAQDVISEGVEQVVLLGMGGSSRSAKAIRASLAPGADCPELIAAESTLPAVVDAMARSIDPKRSLVILSSKSGTTMEPLALYRVLRKVMDDVLGGQPGGRRFVAITDPGSPLADIAAAEGFRRVFLSEPSIGGRFSALTHFGLLPAALLGLDPAAMVDQGSRMRSLCGPERGTEANPAARLGAALGTLALAGRDKLTLVASPRLEGFALWLEQLVAESLGKDGRGIIPITGEPLMAPDCYGEDRLFVHLKMSGDEIQSPEDPMCRLKRSGHYVLTINVEGTEELGAEFFLWEMAVAVAAAVIGVNPFSQPDVQLSKDRTRLLLQAAGGAQTPFRDSLSAREGAIELHSLLAASQENDYLGILSFLHHSAEMEEALAGLRETVLRQHRMATALGRGPEYLHSTGQVHKGGPDSGIFLLLTAPRRSDMAIPGAAYTLGDVTDADALGDLDALCELGKRLVHVQLCDDSPEAMESFKDNLECQYSRHGR